MFIRKSWLPVSVFLIAIIGVGLYLLTTQTPKAPLKSYKPVEVRKIEATPKPPPPGETYETGHWHGDEWHANDAHAPAEVATPPSEPNTPPSRVATAPTQVSLPAAPDFSGAYEALREKYPEQTRNPPPFENVPVDLWDFEATKKAFQDHFNFYVAHYDPKEGWSHTRELRIADAVMANISNAADPWVGLFTPEQRKEIKEMRRRFREFVGVKINHERVSELVKNEGYSVSEALDISYEEGSNQ